MAYSLLGNLRRNLLGLLVIFYFEWIAQYF